MAWTPPAELERLVTIVANDRREAYHAAVSRDTEALDSQLAARGLINSGTRVSNHQEVMVRSFEECASGTIADVLSLVRELHHGEVPVESAPWLRELLLGWIRPVADHIAEHCHDIAARGKMNVDTSRFYPRAAMGKAERRIALELGKLAYKAELSRLTPPLPAVAPAASGADVFISHASEDKEDVARPLAGLLRAAGFSYWLDEAEIKLGDRLLDKIDEGIGTCRFGVVILSPHFFAKNWPRRELAGLAAREDAEARKLILPVWHRLDQSEVAKHSPLLAGVYAASTSNGLESVVAAIIAVLKS